VCWNGPWWAPKLLVEVPFGVKKNHNSPKNHTNTDKKHKNTFGVENQYSIQQGSTIQSVTITGLFIGGRFTYPLHYYTFLPLVDYILRIFQGYTVISSLNLLYSSSCPPTQTPLARTLRHLAFILCASPGLRVIS
jgi:hypothetical protein